MSRAYDVNFMTEDDLITLFNDEKLSHKPTESEIKGTWEGMLVSDSAVTPRTQIFYFDYEDGQIDMRYSFANMLQGRSDVNIKDRLVRLDDRTPFHDEIRMVTPNFLVGRWITQWTPKDILKPYYDDFTRILNIPILANTEPLYKKLSHIFSTHGMRLPNHTRLSFLNVEEDDKNNEIRLGLSYILKRIG